MVGVSTMTVSRALGGSPLVTAETAARITAAARELGYTPNLAASSLISGRSRIVGAVVPSIRNSQAANMLQGLGDRLADEGCHLIVMLAGDRDSQSRVVATLSGRRPDGIVLSGRLYSAAVGETLRAARIRVVETWSLDGPFADAAVGFDNHAAARDMTAAVIDRGYRRIGFAHFADPGQAHRGDRWRGFRDAMRARSLAPDLVCDVPVSAGFASGPAALRTLEALAPDLDAIVCGSDVIAAGVIFECQRRGWPVPGRLAVTGFGDFELSSEMVPRITTVRTNAYALGQEAARLVTSPADDPGGDPAPRVVDVGFELILRESC